MDADDKLMAARCLLLATQSFYGTFCMQMDWREDKFEFEPHEERKTMGVRVTSNGRIECIWYRPFLDKLTVKQLYTTIQHEVEHVLRLHCIRRTDQDPLIWNIAADMCVNGTYSKPRIGWHYDRNVEESLPFGNKSRKGMIWIPDDWPNDQTVEYYYDRLMNDSTTVKVNCSVDGADGENSPKTLDNHGNWNNVVSKEELRQIVHEHAKNAAAQCQGEVPGHVIELIKALAKPIVNWKHILKVFIGRHVGNKRSTYSRRNRRVDAFGVKGYSRHAAGKVSIIIDTSGSISSTDLEQFFGEIEAISGRAVINVLQWDHAFQGLNMNYRRGDWKKIKVKGRGGTDMEAPVRYLAERRLIGNACIMLTDGYCNYADPQNFPMITCISTAEGTAPNWGKVIRLHEKS